MNITVSSNYVLKYELSSAPKYKWTECGRCFNVKTGREIRKTLNGRSVGYCIDSKFKSLSTLRKQLTRIEDYKCPF